jgi:hypothetical protein
MLIPVVVTVTKGWSWYKSHFATISSRLSSIVVYYVGIFLWQNHLLGQKSIRLYNPLAID